MGEGVVTDVDVVLEGLLCRGSKVESRGIIDRPSLYAIASDSRTPVSILDEEAPVGKSLQLLRARGDQLKTETKLGRGQAVENGSLPHNSPLSYFFNTLGDPIALMDARGPPK